METRKFLNQYQPQTLQISTMLLYINAVFALLQAGRSSILVTLATIAGAAGAYGIANDKKWGYGLGLVAAIIPLLWTVYVVVAIRELPFGLLINLLFEVALLALLTHPLSRGYVKTWFK